MVSQKSYIVKRLLLTTTFLRVLVLLNAQEAAYTDTLASSATIGYSGNQIAVISLNIVDSEKGNSVQLTHMRAIKSSKKISEQSRHWIENDLVGFILNDQEQILDTLLIQQPLKVRYEYPDENIETLGRTTIDLTKNDVLIRFPYTNSMKFIRIYKVDGRKQLKLIDTLSLEKKN